MNPEEEMTPEEAEIAQKAAIAGMVSEVTAPNADLGEHYERVVAYADRLAPHAFGESPEDILERKRPNEHPDIKEYRLASYEPITEPEFGSAVTATKRIFSPGLFSVTHPDPPAWAGAENAPEDFFENGFGYFGSVMNYTQEVLLPNIYGDPNAVLVVMPAGRTTEEDMIQPMPMIYGSDKVLKFIPGELCIILTPEKSMVSTGAAGERREGKVLLVIMPNIIFKAHQTGRKQDNQYRIEDWESYPIGELPVKILGGRHQSRNGENWYKSFFDPAIPFWNKAIQAETELDGMYLMGPNGQKIVLSIPCKICDGRGETGSGETCKGCKGSGNAVSTRTSKSGSYMDMEINPDATDIKPSEAIHYPPSMAQDIEVQEKREAKWLNKAAEKLFVDVLNKVGTNQSGVAKAYDRDGLYTFLGDIAATVAGHIAFMYRMGILWRYMPYIYARGTKSSWDSARKEALELMPQIKAPFQFQINSMGDLIATRKAAVDAGVPDCVIRGMDSEISLKGYGSGTVANLRAQAEIALNPYGSMGEDTYLAKKQNGMIIPELDFINTNITFLMDTAIERAPGFLKLPREEQRKVMQELTKEFRPAPPVVPLLPGMGGAGE